MGVGGYMKSVFKTVPAEQNFDAIAGALKNAYDIDMSYLNHVEGDQYIFNLSKGNLKLRFIISKYEYEDGLYEQIIRENVTRFRKQLDAQQIQDAMNRKAITTMSGKNANIVIDDLKIAEDVNITRFSKEDLDAIKKMKTAASTINALGKNPIIAGGFFASIFHGLEPKDIDIYYLDGDVEENFVFHNLDKDGVVKNHEYLKNPNIIKVKEYKKSKKQLIFTKYKTRRELIDHFDMLHCCVSYDVKEDKLYISPATLEAIKHKGIMPNGKNKIAQWRLDKMMSRGWTMVPK